MQPTCSPEIMKLYENQSLQDLKDFFEARVAELVPGGVFVHAIPITNEPGKL